MATGITVANATVNSIQEFKKNDNKLKYVICKIENDEIVLEFESESDSFAEYVGRLPENDCRFCYYKMDFETTDGRPNTKIVSISW